MRHLPQRGRKFTSIYRFSPPTGWSARRACPASAGARGCSITILFNPDNWFHIIPVFHSFTKKHIISLFCHFLFPGKYPEVFKRWISYKHILVFLVEIHNPVISGEWPEKLNLKLCRTALIRYPGNSFHRRGFPRISQVITLILYSNSPILSESICRGSTL